jgi:hypothetical protein
MIPRLAATGATDTGKNLDPGTIFALWPMLSKKGWTTIANTDSC